MISWFIYISLIIHNLSHGYYLNLLTRFPNRASSTSCVNVPRQTYLMDGSSRSRSAKAIKLNVVKDTPSWVGFGNIRIVSWVWWTRTYSLKTITHIFHYTIGSIAFTNNKYTRSNNVDNLYPSNIYLPPMQQVWVKTLL